MPVDVFRVDALISSYMGTMATKFDTHLSVVEPVKEFKKSLCPLLMVWGFFEAGSSCVTQGSSGTLFVTLNDLKLYSLQPPFAKRLGL